MPGYVQAERPRRHVSMCLSVRSRRAVPVAGWLSPRLLGQAVALRCCARVQCDMQSMQATSRAGGLLLLLPLPLPLLLPIPGTSGNSFEFFSLVNDAGELIHAVYPDTSTLYVTRALPVPVRCPRAPDACRITGVAAARCF